MIQTWALGLLKTYLVKNWRTAAIGVIGFILTQFPQTKAFLVSHGYSITDLQAAILMLIGVFAKDGSVSGTSKAPDVPAENVLDGMRGAGAALLLIGSLALPVFALAADPTAGTVDGAGMADSVAQASPKLGILSLDLGRWDTHANVGFSGVQVDLRTGAASYEAVSGLYALCYKPWMDACAAGGGGLTLQGGKVTGAVKIGALSPQFFNPFQAGSGSGGFRLALTYGHDFATNGDTANAGLVFTF